MGGSASIRGRVVDDRGGILPGATVTLTNDATGWSATVLSDRNGGFQFAALPGGSYSLTTELSGFAPRYYTGIPVSDGKSDAYEISLELSTVSETITVAGETPPRLSFRAGDEEGIGARVPGRGSSTPAGARRWRQAGRGRDLGIGKAPHAHRRPAPLLIRAEIEVKPR